ncbi:MAG: MFS transporter [Dehalococcoidales bacterium]|nr:MFS transporter [Dehalococcoidales bacterium]
MTGKAVLTRANWYALLHEGLCYNAAVTRHRRPDSTESSNRPLNSRNILLFCAATFFFWAALYLYVPTLPVYSQSVGASLSMVGVIVAAYALPQLLLRIPIGVWFDALARRKPLLVGGIMAASLGALGLGLATGPWMLFGARIMTGIGAATWVIFTVYFTGYYAPPDAKRAISIINFVQGIALVVASYGGGLVAQAGGYSSTFWGAAAFGLLALVAVLLGREPAISGTKHLSWKDLRPIITYRPLIIVSLMGLLSQFANWAGLFGFVPVYGASIGASSNDLGIITTLCLASSAIAALFMPRAVRLWGTSWAILVGAVLLGGMVLLVPLVHSVSILKLVMLINGLGRGLLATLLMALSIQTVPPQQRATAMGIYQAIYAMGMLAGPLVSGFLADSLGLSAAFYLSTLCCLATAGIAFLPAVRHLELK